MTRSEQVDKLPISAHTFVDCDSEVYIDTGTEGALVITGLYSRFHPGGVGLWPEWLFATLLVILYFF